LHFRVVSFVILHALGDAPEIRVVSERPIAFIRDLPTIERILYPRSGAECWTRPYCLNGEWREAIDSHGNPFVATGGQSTIDTGVGGWGSQWVRPGLPYPFAHG
jgi:hypothetical protein